MSDELLYTSAPRGLRPGTGGFCTVAATSSLGPAWTARLEAMSGYKPHFPAGDPREVQNPIAFAHTRLTVAGQTRSVLSRACFAGFDHTGRSNKFAHHLLLSDPERSPAGPAALLRHPGVMSAAWDGGEPRTLPSRVLPKLSFESRVATTWQQETGDAGWAGILAEYAADDPNTVVYIVYEIGSDILALVDEAIHLLPESRRWQVTFNTYLTEQPVGSGCAWRCVVAGTPAAAMARGHILELATLRGREAPADLLVTAARTGQLLKRAAEHTASLQASSASATILEPAATRPVAAQLSNSSEPLPFSTPKNGTLVRQVAAWHRRPLWPIAAAAAMCCAILMVSAVLISSKGILAGKLATGNKDTSSTSPRIELSTQSDTKTINSQAEPTRPGEHNEARSDSRSSSAPDEGPPLSTTLPTSKLDRETFEQVLSTTRLKIEAARALKRFIPPESNTDSIQDYLQILETIRKGRENNLLRWKVAALTSQSISDLCDKAISSIDELDGIIMDWQAAFEIAKSSRATTSAIAEKLATPSDELEERCNALAALVSELATSNQSDGTFAPTIGSTRQTRTLNDTLKDIQVASTALEGILNDANAEVTKSIAVSEEESKARELLVAATKQAQDTIKQLEKAINDEKGMTEANPLEISGNHDTELRSRRFFKLKNAVTVRIIQAPKLVPPLPFTCDPSEIGSSGVTSVRLSHAAFNGRSPLTIEIRPDDVIYINIADEYKQEICEQVKGKEYQTQQARLFGSVRKFSFNVTYKCVGEKQGTVNEELTFLMVWKR